tara:strand:+ start:272 stop:748 length:477 start_codon:yes stop_codon:yes gene_type:complete
MPISAATFADRKAGYTLAELLVVLVIVGLTLTFVAPRLFFTSEASQVRRAAETLELSARAARAAARLTGRDAILVVDVDARRAWVEPDGQAYTLPDSVDIRATVAESELDEERAAIRFFAEGGSTGGTYEVEAGDTMLIVQIDWITGLTSRGVPDDET